MAYTERITNKYTILFRDRPETNVFAVYPKLNPVQLNIRFLLLCHNPTIENIYYETEQATSKLKHNVNMHESDALYGREQRIRFKTLQYERP